MCRFKLTRAEPQTAPNPQSHDRTGRFDEPERLHRDDGRRRALRPGGNARDVTGALRCSSSAPLGYSGVVVSSPQGRPLGRIRLPEVCANVAFGSPQRNHLFMCASQSRYVVRTQPQGASTG